MLTAKRAGERLMLTVAELIANCIQGLRKRADTHIYSNTCSRALNFLQNRKIRDPTPNCSRITRRAAKRCGRAPSSGNDNVYISIRELLALIQGQIIQT